MITIFMPKRCAQLRKLSTLSLFGIAVACAPSETNEYDRDAELRRQLSDVVIYNDTATVQLSAGGALTAKIKSPDTGAIMAASGTWTVEEGQFCRNLTEAPEGIERQLCEWVNVEGRTVSFDGLEPDGRLPVEYSIR